MKKGMTFVREHIRKLTKRAGMEILQLAIVIVITLLMIAGVIYVATSVNSSMNSAGNKIQELDWDSVANGSYTP